MQPPVLPRTDASIYGLHPGYRDPFTLWINGPPGSGKSTLAYWFRFKLPKTVLISGGLYGELAAKAKVANETGQLAIVDCDSQDLEQHQAAREILGQRRFHRIHMTTPLRICKIRYRKGNYPSMAFLPNPQGVSIMTVDTTQMPTMYSADRIIHGFKKRLLQTL